DQRGEGHARDARERSRALRLGRGGRRGGRRQQVRALDAPALPEGGDHGALALTVPGAVARGPTAEPLGDILWGRSRSSPRGGIGMFPWDAGFLGGGRSAVYILDHSNARTPRSPA